MEIQPEKGPSLKNHSGILASDFQTLKREKKTYHLSNLIYENDIIAAETKTDVIHILYKILIDQ